MKVSVRLTPAGPPISSDTTAVAIDVLRATSTLTVAFDHGASRVIPCATPEAALALRAGTPDAWVCGERDGRIVPGFDRGNSPFEYPAAEARGRTLLFASTNGSLALLAARGARRVVLAAFVNATAVVALLRGDPRIVIVCAGKQGRFALEDAACAGLLCAKLRAEGATLEGSDAALAVSLAPTDARDVRALVQGCAHGRVLRALGEEFARDVEFCAGLDTRATAHAVSVEAAGR